MRVARVRAQYAKSLASLVIRRRACAARVILFTSATQSGGTYMHACRNQHTHTHTHEYYPHFHRRRLHRCERACALLPRPPPWPPDTCRRTSTLKRVDVQTYTHMHAHTHTYTRTQTFTHELFIYTKYYACPRAHVNHKNDLSIRITRFICVSGSSRRGGGSFAGIYRSCVASRP